MDLLLSTGALLVPVNDKALLNQGMNADCAGSRAKVSLHLGFKNPRKEDSYLKSATPSKLLFNNFDFFGSKGFLGDNFYFNSLFQVKF
ncbi:hypothetical protein NIES3804_04450 [Microcystis aeruginosa NIES-3804]|jgi:hypothetical protein|uniref:Uncharacterized protein n=2 Tax=Microcystis TaxID=1125 RepID=A0A6H9GFE9_MICAE|nr:MAG: hypothetical protein EWV40_14965 [Microcystis flos-aquae Mf_WU_F_19750830_S460]GCL48894.1 hypothetical protein NIES3804_04450 [Microcystis aeruginosa NIES-3804]